MSEILSGRCGDGGLTVLGGDCLTIATVGGGGGVACFSAGAACGVDELDPVFLRKMLGDLGPCRTLDAAALMLAVAVLIAAGGPFLSRDDLADPAC
jgi:hypothetical protein